MKFSLAAFGRKIRKFLIATALAPVTAACGHLIDPTMVPMPIYEQPAAVVVQTPPVSIASGGMGGTRGFSPGIQRLQSPTSPMTRTAPSGATVIQQAPIRMQRPAIMVNQPPIWIGNPPVAIAQPPIMIRQPPILFQQPGLVLHPPRVEFQVPQNQTLYPPQSHVVPQPYGGAVQTTPQSPVLAPPPAIPQLYQPDMEQLPPK